METTGNVRNVDEWKQLEIWTASPVSILRSVLAACLSLAKGL